MGTSGRDEVRVAVRINPNVWREEVERLDRHSPGRVAAERERRGLEDAGLNVMQLLRCAGDAEDRTRLLGLLKVYVPIGEGPPSARPYGFVLSAGRDEDGGYVELVAFGERHPQKGTRSVYDRAHKRRHGRYPDQ